MPPTVVAALTLVLGVANAGVKKDTFHPGHKILPHLPRKLKARLRSTRLLSPFDATAMSQGGGLRVTPVQFGGDPTGQSDSTSALLKAVEFCVNASSFHKTRTFPDGAGDAGGCTVDLEGGEFLISETLVIPTYTSNVRIQTGSLVANPKSSRWQARPEPFVKARDTSCTFPDNRTDQWCQGMVPGPVPESDSSPGACEETCCSTPGCLAWQFCDPSAPCAESLSGRASCWFNPSGTSFDPTTRCRASNPSDPRSMGWVGGSSKKPNTPDIKTFFLIQVGGTETCVSYHQGSCNEDIGFPGLFLDGSHVANGIQINEVMGTTVGPQTYILNFTRVGIEVNGGHEVMIDTTWLGETNFDYNYSAPGAGVPMATAIHISSNDHYVLDSIVFSSLLGLNMGGAANLINGLHVWFPQNAAEATGATAFYNTGAQNRYENCYIDCSHAIFVNPDRVQWLNGFTLGGKGIELQGNVTNVRIKGVQNGPITWTGNTITDTIENTIISEILASRLNSQPTLSSTSTAAQAVWNFDFCEQLPFPNITSVVSMAFTSNDPASSVPVTVVARQPRGCTLTVDATPATAGTLVVKVDSSTYV